MTNLTFLSYIFFLTYIILTLQRHPGLVAHYPLNGSFSEIDGLHGDIQISNTRYTHGVRQAANRHGVPNTAYILTKDYDTLKIPCSSVTGLVDFTISIWSVCTTTCKYDSALFSISNAASSFGNHFTQLNRYFWLMLDGSGDYIQYNFDEPAFTSKWQHFLITRHSKDNKVSIYRDGKHFDDVTNYVDLKQPLNCEGFYLGNDQDWNDGGFDNDQQFFGSLTDLRIYNVGLTAEEIAKQYKEDTSCKVKYCLDCKRDYYECDRCADNAIYSIEQQECVCPPSYFNNPVDQECQKCPIDCLECTYEDSLICTKCKDVTSFSFIENGVCKCQDEYFMNNSNQQCSKCEQHCSKCTDFNQCQLCKDSTLAQISDGYCKCQASYYMDLTSSICKECHGDCSLCTNINECTQCKDTNWAYIDQGICKCPVGYYMDSTSSICLQCEETCHKCTGAEECQECKDSSSGQVQIIDGICKCPNEYFMNPSSFTCQECDEKCNICKNELECLECKDNQNGIIVDGQCQSPVGFFMDQMTFQIHRCGFGCQECDSGTDCKKCKDLSLGILGDNGECSCPLEYYMDPLTFLCKEKDKKCEKYSRYGVCEACVDQNVAQIIEGVCKCPPKYYMDPQNFLCQECEQSCGKCENQILCLECIDPNNAIIQDGKCQCREKYLMNQETQMCEPCPKNCLSCKSQNQCIQCVDQSVASILFGQCSCPQSFYMNDQTSRCQECILPGCTQCISDSQCSKCLESMELNENQQCECPTGFYISQENICAKCMNNCLKCENDNHCLVCEENRDEITGCGCKKGFELDQNKKCVKREYQSIMGVLYITSVVFLLLLIIALSTYIRRKYKQYMQSKYKKRIAQNNQKLHSELPPSISTMEGVDTQQDLFTTHSSNTTGRPIINQDQQIEPKVQKQQRRSLHRSKMEPAGEKSNIDFSTNTGLFDLTNNNINNNNIGNNGDQEDYIDIRENHNTQREGNMQSASTISPGIQDPFQGDNLSDMKNNEDITGSNEQFPTNKRKSRRKKFALNKESIQNTDQ